MKKILFPSFLLFLLTLNTANAQTYSGPESVEFDYANNRWLIANTTSHQVLARSASGLLSIFASNLVNGPHGIEIAGDTLFCCSGSSIKGYSLSGGTLVFNVNLGASFLNGLTHDNSGNLWATDFSAKTIYKINIAAQTFTQVAGSLVQSPNGIIYDDQNSRCVFVNWGSNAPIKAINVNTNVVTTILPTTFSNIDGIARDGAGNYYISVWGTQRVYKYDSSFSSTAVSVVSSLSSPADIFYNVVGDTLAIPNSGNNTVTFVGFTPTGIVQEAKETAQMNIYPNPCTGNCQISIPSSNDIVSILLSSSDGKILNGYTATGLSSEGKTIIALELNELSSGLYFIEVISGSNIYRCKIIFN
jgi:Secretion system C-terminal sorting domain